MTENFLGWFWLEMTGFKPNFGLAQRISAFSTKNFFGLIQLERAFSSFEFRWIWRFPVFLDFFFFCPQVGPMVGGGATFPKKSIPWGHFLQKNSLHPLTMGPFFFDYFFSGFLTENFLGWIWLEMTGFKPNFGLAQRISAFSAKNFFGLKKLERAFSSLEFSWIWRFPVFLDFFFFSWKRLSFFLDFFIIFNSKNID